MFNQITWADYISTIATITFFYYCFIAARYYRHDLAWWIYCRQNKITTEAGTNIPQQSFAVQQFENELQAFCGEASQHKFERHSIVSSISLLLQRYELHRDPFAKAQLEQMIAGTCHQHCKVQLDEDDMATIWRTK